MPKEIESPNEPTGDKSFLLPKTVYADPDRKKIDVLGTIAEHQESHAPELRTTKTEPGDILKIESADGSSSELFVSGIKIRDYSFGSDDLKSPGCEVKDADGNTLTIRGSSTTPRGSMMTTGTVGVGKHLVLYDEATRREHVSPEVITNFSLKRADETGELREVRLNATEKLEESDSFRLLSAQFETIVEELDKRGFRFDEEDERGNYNNFVLSTDTEIIYAARTGFGCKVIPQYEIHLYDSLENSLISLRYITGEQTMAQVAIMNITPKEFAKAASSHPNIDDLSWQKVDYISSTTLHSLSHTSPFVTYTWLSPDDDPSINIIFDPDGRSMTSSSITEFTPQSKLNIIIAPDGQSVKANNPDWRIKDPKDFMSRQEEETTLNQTGPGSVSIDYYEHHIDDIGLNPLKDTAKIVSALRRPK